MSRAQLLTVVERAALVALGAWLVTFTTGLSLTGYSGAKDAAVAGIDAAIAAVVAVVLQLLPAHNGSTGGDVTDSQA